MQLPSKYLYPFVTIAFLASWVLVFVNPEPIFVVIVFVSTLAVIALGLNYLVLLLGIGTRIRTQNILKLSAEIIKIDGVVSEKEKLRVKKSLENDFPALLGKFRYEKFERYLTQKNELKPITTYLRDYDNRFKINLLREIVSIAVGDKLLTEKEELFLNQIIKGIRIPKSTLESILSLHYFVYEDRNRNKKPNKVKPVFSSDQSYKILGLERISSLEEVKKAYRELAKVYHPDKVRDKKLKENAKIQFQAITEAYESIKKEKG